MHVVGCPEEPDYILDYLLYPESSRLLQAFLQYNLSVSNQLVVS